MKRRMVATLTVLLAFAGRGLPQAPNRLPEPGTAIEPVPLAAPESSGRALIVSPDQPPAAKPIEGPSEKIANPEPVAVPQAAAKPNGDFGNNCGNGKPSLAVTHTGPPEQFWLRGSYLYWRVADQPLPDVLASVNGTPVVGGPAGNADFGNFSGVRIEAGAWLDCQHTCGVEGGGFILQQRDRSNFFSSNGAVGSPVISRPIIDALTSTPLNVLVSAPGLSGSLNIVSDLQLGGAELNFTRNICYDCSYSFDALMGVRFIDLEEQLEISQVSAQTNGATLPFAGATGFSRVTATDRFHTRNQLWGGQVGGRFEAHRGIFYGSVVGKVAIGPNLQATDIVGNSTASGPAGNSSSPSGVLALAGTNASNGTTRWWAVAPEVGLQVGAQVTKSLRVYVGYDFLYINNVVRPGDLVNTTVNQSFVPISSDFDSTSGTKQPAFRTSRDDFFAHGVEFGLQIQY